MSICGCWPSALAAIFVLLTTASCGREADPPQKKRDLSPLDARPEPAAGVAEAVAEAASVEAPPPAADTAHGIAPVSAEGLRNIIRAAGSKATLVNAWASWCGPCRREVPMLQGLAANLKRQGVRVLLVSVDSPSDAAKASAFLKDNGIDLKSYIVEGGLGEFQLGMNPRWPGMLPASFLFDAQGQLKHFWGGEAFEHEMLPVIESFLAGRPIESETRFGLAPGKVGK